MVHRLVIAVALVLAALSVAAPTQAGGWAAVRVTDNPGDPVLGQPWTATLLVKQHDVDPIDVNELTVRFTHQESGATLDATGASTGETGGYRITVTFDKPGLWDWQATPAPFPPANMRTLRVVEEPAAAPDLTASLVTGSCDAPSSAFGSLDIGYVDGGDSAAIGVTTGLAYLTKYTAGGPTAVVVREGGAGGKTIACGALPTGDLTEPAVVLLDTADGGYAGSLTLTPTGVDVVAALVVLPTQGAGVVIRITDDGGGMFRPSTITVPVGTTVTWINESGLSHTVSARTAGYGSSGAIAPGERFSETFATAGDFKYQCDPHGWMEGSVSVVD